MAKHSIILSFILILFLVSTSYSDTSNPLRITIYPSRIDDLGVGSNKIIITKNQIEQSSAKNLPELLSQQTGIQNLSLYGGIDDTKASIGMGGFGEQASMNTAIFLNGVRINNISIASVNFGNIVLDNIEKIEIIKGSGASVLYGDGAVAGAINIVTNKNIFKKKSFILDQSVMSFNGRKTNVSATQNTNDFSIQFNHNYTRSDQYRDNNNYKLDSSSINLSTINDDGVYGYFKINKFDEDIRMPGGISLSEYYLNPKKTNEPDAFSREEFSSLELGYYDLYFGDINTNGSISYSKKVSTSYFDASWGDSSNQYNYDSLQIYKKGQIKKNLFAQPIIFNIGVDFYNTDYSDKVLLGTYYKRKAEQITLDPWFIGQTFFDNGFDIEVGIRHHFYELDVYDETTVKQKLYSKSSDANAWSLGGTKKINDKNIVNLKLSKSFRSPKVDEVLHYGGVISEVEHQNSKMFEIGHKSDFEHFIIKTNAFRSKNNNLIYYNGSVNDNYTPTIHEGYNIETNMIYNDNINFKVNLSHVTSEFETGSNQGKQLPMVANITANSAIYYNFEEGFNLSLSNQFVGSRYRIGDEANTNQKAKSYNIYNAKLNYNLNDFEASLKLNNILDKNYYHYNNWGSIYPLPGRNFSLNINYSF